VFHVKLNTRSIVERLSEPQKGRLHAYAGLLLEKAVPLGFVAASDAPRLWDRHVLDSLRALRCLRASDLMVVDVGSGAGLPGIPLAIALPKTRFTLVEPKQRRAALLEAIVASLELANASVAARRAEELDLRADVCLSRALAGPAESWRRASPLLVRGGRVVYWAGRSWEESEIERLGAVGAKAEICFEAEFQWQGPLVIMSRFPQGFQKGHERGGKI
jgi:16S rRNA (guanine527-N7)-methyltransferase